MEKIHQRQERGEKLTGAEYAFLDKVKQANLEMADVSTEPVKLPLPQRLQAFKEKLFDSLCWVVEHSKSHLARVSAAPLKSWAEQEDVPLEGYELVEAHPEDA